MRLVARDGIAALRYEEVAELAGVHRTSVYRNWPDREELVTAALLQYSGTVELEDTGDLRHDLVDYLVALAGLLSTTTGRAMQRAIQDAGRTPRSPCPSIGSSSSVWPDSSRSWTAPWHAVNCRRSTATSSPRC